MARSRNDNQVTNSTSFPIAKSAIVVLRADIIENRAVLRPDSVIDRALGRLTSASQANFMTETRLRQ
jgi:hypothetical protein